VLETGSQLVHGVDVHTPLVGEGGAADEGGAGIVLKVGQFIHESGEVGEFAEMARGKDLFAELKLQDGQNGGEVTVAGSFPVAVQGALDLEGAFFHRGDGVGHAEATVVMGVDADFVF